MLPESHSLVSMRQIGKALSLLTSPTILVTYAAHGRFRLMGFRNWGNGGRSPGRFRNPRLCHFPLDVAKNFFVRFFPLIFVKRHRTIMSRPEKRKWSVQTTSSKTSKSKDR
jgi:hypothetical protein